MLPNHIRSELHYTLLVILAVNCISTIRRRTVKVIAQNHMKATHVEWKKGGAFGCALGQ